MERDRAQKARTESLFRDVNERIADAADEAPVDDVQFVCECGDPACTAGIRLRLDVYDEVRSEPTHFVIKPGHEDTTVERIVEQKNGYDVVEKDVPDAEEIADELDPRA
jgi:hypothetical protein